MMEGLSDDETVMRRVCDLTSVNEIVMMGCENGPRLVTEKPRGGV